MANPQKEDGHIDIANEIAETLARTQLSGYESRILWVLWRKTWGWHKTRDIISVSQFQKFTGLKRRHVQRTLGRLVDRNIITKYGYKHGTKWAFQKDYEKWKEVTKNGAPVTNLGPGVTNLGTKAITKNGAYKRNYTKETKYKRNLILSQIENLKLQFPSEIKSLIEEYIEVAKLENETKKILPNKERRLINELLLIWIDCDHEINKKDFEQALKVAVNNKAPHPNYVRKVMKSREKNRKLKLEKANKIWK